MTALWRWDGLAGRNVYWGAGLLAVLVVVSGCKSAMVDATIDNQGNSALQLLEVDYPSASFGTGSLAAHAQFHYRFKIQGSGSVKMQYVDAANQTRNFTGPELQEGQQGTLTITIDPAGSPSGSVFWKPVLTSKQ